jgi:hypothetical protein
MLKCWKEFSLGVHWSINIVLNIGEGSKLINVIVKELVFVQDAGMSMNVFLFHVRNYYLRHFDVMKAYNSLYRCMLVLRDGHFIS